MKYASEVYHILEQLPPTKVTTYGLIAQQLGNKSLARYVGNVLHHNSEPLKYPCFKVVNSKGFLSKSFGFGGLEGQKKLLTQDGVLVVNDRVDLAIYLVNEKNK
ncbi:MAG: MGMT family protein [Acholeplasmatales bacterium]|jgi:alkylated DNA nucleotide flippase Atl1|nr:MGMT family protein [Acholeplasmatales bacterium]